MRICFPGKTCLAPKFKEGMAIVEGGGLALYNQDTTLQRAIYSLGMATDNFNGSITIQWMQMQSVPFRSIQYSRREDAYIHYMHNITLHYITLHYITLHYITYIHLYKYLHACVCMYGWMHGYMSMYVYVCLCMSM